MARVRFCSDRIANHSKYEMWHRNSFIIIIIHQTRNSLDSLFRTELLVSLLVAVRTSFTCTLLLSNDIGEITLT